MVRDSSSTISADDLTVAKALLQDLEGLEATGRGSVDRYTSALTEVIHKEAPTLDPALAAYLARRSAGNLIASLNGNQRKWVRNATARAINEGWQAEEFRDRLAQHIGLDERYTNAVEGFRKGLIDKGAGKGEARAKSRAYAKRLRSSRAMTIARTEVAKAIGDAKRELWKQWKDEGQIDQYAVRVFHVHKDERLCPVCAPMNGMRGAVDRNYKNGKVGPPLHPNCRCWETLERGPDVLMKSEYHQAHD